MKRLLQLSILLLAFIACNDEDISVDPLNEVGLLGNWELMDRYQYDVKLPNVIDDLAVDLGYIIFETGEDDSDLSGNFEWSDGFTPVEGTFLLSQDDKTIKFTWDGKQLTRTFELSNKSLALSYQEDDVVYVEQYQMP